MCKIPGIAYSLDHLYSVVQPRGEGSGERKRLLTSAQEDEIRYKEREKLFFTALVNYYLLPNEVQVQTLNMVQGEKKATAYWGLDK